MTLAPRLAALLLLLATPLPARAAAIDTGNGEDDDIALAAGSTYTFTAANNGANALPVVTTRITIQGKAVRATPDADRRTALRTVGAEIQADMKTLMGSR